MYYNSYKNAELHDVSNADFIQTFASGWLETYTDAEKNAYLSTKSIENWLIDAYNDDILTEAEVYNICSRFSYIDPKTEDITPALKNFAGWIREYCRGEIG